MKGWEVKNLKEVAETFVDGNWIERKDQSTDGIRLIQTGNVGNGFYKDRRNKARFISEETFIRLRCTEIFEGDILISRLPDPVGRACVLPTSNEKMITAVDCTIIRPNKKEILSKWLLYYTISDSYLSEIQKRVTGATRQRISRKNLGLIPIPLPPLPEQQRIVSILDKAFTAIDKAKANAEQNLKNAKELFESYLQGVFEKKGEDWKMKKLQDVAKVFGRGKSKHRPRNWEGLYNGKYPFVQTGEVRNANKYISSYDQTYNEVGLAQSKLWKKGTICITIAANIAETAILDFDACIPDSIIGFEVDEKKADINFAYYILQFFKSELQKLAKGSAQDNINLGTFKHQYFPFPSLKEQKSIVRQLDAIRVETQKLETLYQKKIDDLEELKKSILQRAFSGQLTATTSMSTSAKIIALQKVDGISPTDLQAGITALALQKHIEKNQQHTFHHVKAEKIVHLSEYTLNIDLDRDPVKDAAGPNDFPHAKKVESRARKAGFYTVSKSGDLYNYQQGSRMDSVIQKAENCLGEKADTLTQIIDMLAPMSTQQAEIVATVYAAWNNLLLTEKDVSDEGIVAEARENWHKDKLNIPREKFFNALEWMRKNELLIPKGNGKLVKQKTTKKK